MGWHVCKAIIITTRTLQQIHCPMPLILQIFQAIKNHKLLLLATNLCITVNFCHLPLELQHWWWLSWGSLWGHNHGNNDKISWLNKI